jgi:hypothetical protein
MKVQRLLLTASLFIILTAPAQAMERIEVSFDWPGFYFTCLDDTLYGTVTYTLLSHEVNTPSGVAHTIESFFGTGFIYSPETLRTWTQRFAIPGTSRAMTINEGETYFWVDHEVYIPDDPHDPLFFIELSYKFTVNANGELVVNLDNWSNPDFPDYYTRCVGTGKESKRKK